MLKFFVISLILSLVSSQFLRSTPFSESLDLIGNNFSFVPILTHCSSLHTRMNIEWLERLSVSESGGNKNFHYAVSGTVKKDVNVEKIQLLLKNDDQVDLGSKNFSHYKSYKTGDEINFDFHVSIPLEKLENKRFSAFLKFLDSDNDNVDCIFFYGNYF